jgi:REP element-mobilizing transposase RayT
MARRPRPQFPGAIYHVWTRGVDRRRIYLVRRDRERFLWQLGDAIERFGWHCLAYCEMTNHYHLVVETRFGNLGAGMKRLNQCYAQSFNREHDRKGHLFESRYSSLVIADEPHLLTELSYVLLNPVRPGVVDHPAAWEWSSYLQTIHEGGVGIVDTSRVLRLLGRTPAEAAHRLETFVGDRFAERRHVTVSTQGLTPVATSGPSAPSSRAASGGPA